MAQHVPARLSSAEGRRFGLTVGAAFLGLAGLTWWRDFATLPSLFGALGLALLSAGLLMPGRLTLVHRAWMALAQAISKVTTPVFLAVVYFGVMMPIGLVMRLFGRNPLRHAPRDNSYWTPRDGPRGGMPNQF